MTITQDTQRLLPIICIEKWAPKCFDDHMRPTNEIYSEQPLEKPGERFCGKLKARLVGVREQQAEATKLDAAIAANLKGLGFGGER